MSLRALAFAAALGFGGAAAVLPPAVALAQPAAMTMDELMHAMALDDIFTQFGPSIESAPAEQGTPFAGAQQAAWQQSVRQVFDADRMHADLARLLSDKFDAADVEAYAAFFTSDFGRKVTAIEREVALLPPESQEGAIDAGLAIAAAADIRRNAQIDEMLELISAEIAVAIVRQSVRGMLIGMSMTGRQGDIEVPWEEVDAQLDAIMPGIEGEVERAQRAMMFYAYADLTEAELDHYLSFLRTDPARKLYAIGAYAIGEIVTERMQSFGEAFARRLAQVSV